MNAPAPSPLPERFPRALSWILFGVSAAFVVAGWLWGGIDFSVGVALGSLIVGLNYFWTRSVIRRVLRGEGSKGRVALSYLGKFGLTVLVLFVAILRFGVDPLAILVGVTSLFVAVIVAFAFHALI